MFILTFNVLWSITYLLFIFYTLLIFSILFYVLPIVNNLNNYQFFNKNFKNIHINGFDLYWIISTFLGLLILINYTWTSPVLSTWFGHLLFTNFQKNFFFLISFTFFIVILVYTSSFYYESREVYDYLIVCFNFYVWLLFLFFANTLFSLIFFIEILSTLIFLLVITSTFSTTYFYNNINFNNNNYFTSSLPITYLQTLMFFFWISLISSLNLFFFLVLFYSTFTTFDWYITEIVFYHINITNQFKDTFSIFLIWTVFIFCIFLKCGLVPFYFWKPVFFRGLPLHVLFFYVVFFYFFLFIYLLFFFLSLFNEIFYCFIFIFNISILIGIVFLFAILCEAYYIKIFLAMSSILNTLFVFLALSGIVEITTPFYL